MLLYPTSTVDHVDLSVSKISENCLYLDRKIEQEEEKIQKEIKAGATSVEFQMKTTLGQTDVNERIFFWEVVFLWGLSDSGSHGKLSGFVRFFSIQK